MHRHQRGLTFIGWLVLLAPLALVLYAAIRLTPVYLNYMKVARTVEQVAQENRNEQTVNAASIRRAIERRLDVESVSYPELKDFVIKRDNEGWFIQIAYEDTVPLFANLSLLVTFDKTERLE